MEKKIELEGERLAWFELASHLQMPVETLKEQITVTEFLEWQEFLRIKRDRDDKLHFYLAQIAAEIRKSFVKNPNSIKLAHFLLKFATGQEARAGGKESPAFKEHKATLSKGAWFAALGWLPGQKMKKRPMDPRKMPEKQKPMQKKKEKR